MLLVDQDFLFFSNNHFFSLRFEVTCVPSFISSNYYFRFVSTSLVYQVSHQAIITFASFLRHLSTKFHIKQLLLSLRFYVTCVPSFTSSNYYFRFVSTSLVYQVSHQAIITFASFLRHLCTKFHIKQLLLSLRFYVTCVPSFTSSNYYFRFVSTSLAGNVVKLAAMHADDPLVTEVFILVIKCRYECSYLHVCVQWSQQHESIRLSRTFSEWAPQFKSPSQASLGTDEQNQHTRKFISAEMEGI